MKLLLIMYLLLFCVQSQFISYDVIFTSFDYAEPL